MLLSEVFHSAWWCFIRVLEPKTLESLVENNSRLLELARACTRVTGTCSPYALLTHSSFFAKPGILKAHQYGNLEFR